MRRERREKSAIRRGWWRDGRSMIAICDCG
jgi:hypothetical protein